MPVIIDEIKTRVDVHAEDRGAKAHGPASTSAGNGLDPLTIERLRPLVLQILQEEMERIHRQQG
ncbi:MAG TPA: hypothetical protein VGO67_23125 [Verrucomicrobiae bacterium]|jgi:hypothetical protein